MYVSVSACEIYYAHAFCTSNAERVAFLPPGVLLNQNQIKDESAAGP